MTIDTETLLPEASSSGDVSSEMVALDLKGTGDILLSPSTTEAPVALPTSSADLFGGELGVDELNEIPSLFDLDTQQMSADLETLGFSTSGAANNSGESNEIPFLVSSSVATTDGSASQVSFSSSDEESNKKRGAAEISEDEESQSSKARRLTRTTTNATTKPAPAAAATVTPSSPTRRPLAPKPPSAKKGSEANDSEDDPTRKTDTSTAHVKALTGSKGAAMCFETVSGTERDTTVPIPNLANADLTPAEKAKFSRDRNRLHARNTRIRKKAYVDELKRTLDVLVQERDTAVAEKDRKGQIEKEERDVRFSVLEEFLRLRGCNERSPGRWNAILEENVTLRLPNLDFYRSPGGGAASKKTLTGVPELMKECNDFTKQMQTGKRGAKKTAGSLNFHCDRPSLLMEGCNVVLDWTATSPDPSKVNMTMRGTCRATFNPKSNRLHAVEMFFDSSPLFA